MPACQKCAKDEPLFEVNGQLLCEHCARAVRNVQLQAQKNGANQLTHEIEQPQKVEAKSCFVVMPPQIRQFVGIVGSVILAVGVFMPSVQFPFVGSVTYIANAKGDGLIILILASISGFFVLQKRYKLLYYTSIGSFSLIGFTFVHFQNKISEMHRMMDRQLADAALETIQLDYGWAFLGMGSLLLLMAAAANDNVRKG